jgi:hypothetical protein
MTENDIQLLRLNAEIQHWLSGTLTFAIQELSEEAKGDVVKLFEQIKKLLKSE